MVRLYCEFNAHRLENAVLPLQSHRNFSRYRTPNWLITYFTTHLLTLYYEICHMLIGYATPYLFCDR